MASTGAISANSRIAAAAADRAALQAEPEEMPLKLAGDEAVARADEMQHLDHRAVGGHGAAGREADRQDRRGNHKPEHDNTAEPSRNRAMARMRSIQPR